MPHQPTHPYKSAAGWALLALAPPLLWWVSHPARQVVIEPMTFVFWHSVVELFAVVVAMLVFITGYRAILSARKGAFVLLAVAFLGVAALDFLHSLSYAGMPDAITLNTPHKSMFFWLAARTLAACALLVYVVLPAVRDVTKLKKHRAVATVRNTLRFQVQRFDQEPVWRHRRRHIYFVRHGVIVGRDGDHVRLRWKVCSIPGSRSPAWIHAGVADHPKKANDYCQCKQPA